MKIGLVRRGYSPTGGAERYLLRIAHALLVAGHEPALFVSPGWPRETWPAERGFFRVEGDSPRAFAARLEALNPGGLCERVFSLERVWRCDCYRAGDGVHRAWLERRTAAESPWRARLRHWNPKHRQILALEESLFGQGGAERIIANSDLVRREIIRHYPACPPGRIAVVHNGLPSWAYRPPALAGREGARAALGLEPDDLAILFAGTGWERKGLSVTLAAMERLPKSLNVRLLVAGRGDARRYLQRVPHDVAARVCFLGPVAEMAEIYAAADLFVLPTLYDPFSNACLEALACGLPVLTTPANGFAEILTPGVDGEIFDGPDELAAAITAWADPDRRAAARPEAAAKASRFTIEANVQRTMEILTGAATS